MSRFRDVPLTAEDWVSFLVGGVRVAAKRRTGTAGALLPVRRPAGCFAKSTKGEAGPVRCRSDGEAGTGPQDLRPQYWSGA